MEHRLAAAFKILDNKDFQARAAMDRQRERALIAASRRKRWQTDPAARALCTMRTRITGAMRAKGARKAYRGQELLGCSPIALRRHIEGLFKRGMTWENYGEWEVDHIVPCSAFDLFDPAQQRRCFHYSNLRPLWASENRRKCANLITCQPELLIRLE